MGEYIFDDGSTILPIVFAKRRKHFEAQSEPQIHGTVSRQDSFFVRIVKVSPSVGSSVLHM